MNAATFIQENLITGVLCEGAMSINAGQHRMWKGFIATNNGEVEAYIKECRNPNVIIAELITALIGRVYGLPIPRPIIVKVEPNHPDIVVAETMYFFGSESEEYPNFERFLRDYSASDQLILDYKDLHKIIAFDELLANPDRNNGNILYDGENFKFIDHEYCLNPKQNPKGEIADDFRIGNISDIYKHYRGSNDVDIHKIMRKVNSCVAECFKESHADALNVLNAVNLNATSYAERTKFTNSFILERLTVLDVLVKNSITQDSDDSQLSLAGGWNV
ncbi:MAG TPA: hypothetical protein EYH52_16575 [Acinetobacter venetianus]|jgi:hypothetical protein|uniref:HipA family kinase n=1 Tax=Acinetobacter venetianus TaxID=52133 RepID=UPI001A14D122|nr:HipA family kinase [Acinetobacter venetianus]HIQ36210.1 hypothetical protein [Acinetobacter venetianus]